MKTLPRRPIDPFDKSLQAEFLRKTSVRSWRIGVIVAALLAVVNVIQIIVGAHGGWHSVDEQIGWLFGGSILAAIIGGVVGYIYYTIVAWQEL